MTDEEIQSALKASIEALSDQKPMWSRSAYTHRYTAHVAFCNGELKREGIVALEVDDVEKAASDTLKAVTEYRNRIAGPANLIWRQEPMITRDDGLRVYCRLSFEAPVA